jgi:hypothetical protein
VPRKKSSRADDRKGPAEVFLNLPYDPDYENLFLAYIAAIYAFGMVPRVALEVVQGAKRLDQIFDLMRSCEYSVHDLSKVHLDTKRPCTPRFNMPFELGLAVAWQRISGNRHKWLVMESVPRRLAKSTSDLHGTRACIHNGRVSGIFREITKAFPQITALHASIGNHRPVGARDTHARLNLRGARKMRAQVASRGTHARASLNSTVSQMWSLYRQLRNQLPAIYKRTRTRSVFHPVVFRQLSVIATHGSSQHTNISRL